MRYCVGNVQKYCVQSDVMKYCVGKEQSTVYKVLFWQSACAASYKALTEAGE